MTKKFNILGVDISAIDMNDARTFIENSVDGRVKSYISVSPVSTIMGCYKNEIVRNAVNSASLVTPDGMPVVWIGKIKGHKNIRRVYGPDLMLEICEISAARGYRNYFYGCVPQVLDKLEKKLKNIFPNLIIAGMYSPPFRQLTKEEDDEIVNSINSVKADIVWVGLGSPKQDLWMYEHRDKINAYIMIGVGAAFDFIAGTKPQAPKWIRNNGFEWLFRLCVEPRRLWRRYLIESSLFVVLVGWQMLLDFFKKISGK